MNIPKYITNNESYVVISNQEIINHSNINHAHGTWVFSNDLEVVMMIDQYSEPVNLVIDEGVKAKLFVVYKHQSAIHHQLEVEVGKNASLEIYHDYQNSRATKIDIEKNYYVRENGHLLILNQLIYKGELALHETVHLLGKHASVDIEILNVGQREHTYEIHQNVNHQATHTRSQIHNWMLSLDQSKLTYFVNGSIAKGKEKSSCKQSNKGIILNQKGEIKVVPTLLIDEYDVEASHGAAIGQMDENQLFYLLSRGLSESDAKGLIISGYVNPFVNRITNESLRQLLTRRVNRLFRG